MSVGIVVPVILLAVVAIAALINLHEKVERLERRLDRLALDGWLGGEPTSRLEPARMRRFDEPDADDLH